MQAEAFATLTAAVRRFVYEDVPPHEAEFFATERLPEPLRARMARLGLFGMDVPAALGGLGLTTVQTCALVETLCHGPQALVRWAGPHHAWVRDAEDDPERQALIEKYLDRILQGRLRMAFTLTEPDAGTDAAAIRTRAERRGDVYVLNGRKHLISFAGAAEVYLTFVKTDPDAGAYGVTALLVLLVIAFGRVNRPVGLAMIVAYCLYIVSLFGGGSAFVS